MNNIFARTLSLALVISAPSTFAQSLAPGLWEAKSSFELNGVPLPSGQEQECISASDAKDAKITITKELKKQGCEITKWTVKGSKLDAALKCQNNDFYATGSIHGSFSEKSYNLAGQAEGTIKDILPSEATLQLKGRWLKKCP